MNQENILHTTIAKPEDLSPASILMKINAVSDDIKRTETLMKELKEEIDKDDALLETIRKSGEGTDADKKVFRDILEKNNQRNAKLLNIRRLLSELILEEGRLKRIEQENKDNLIQEGGDIWEDSRGFDVQEGDRRAA